MAETTFTFFDSDEAEKTALAGANGSGHLAPAAVLYAIDGTQLVGRKAASASLPVVLSTEDLAAITPPAGFATAANQDTGLTTLASILTKLSADPATQTTLAAILSVLGGSLAVTGTFWQATQPVDTELAAAAALADSAVNPTTPMVGASLLGFNGATWDRVRIQNVRKDLSAVTITTIATVWTPASGKKFRLMGGSISVSAACNVLFEDNSAGAGNFVWRTPKLAADTPYNFDLGNGKLSAVADQVLKATSSAAATITGTLYGVEES